jgi:hypothetical protein
MSVINVTVTNAGAANVAVSGGSTVNATVGNGGMVNVALGTISPGNATVVSGTLTINSTTTLAAGSSAYAKNVGTAYAASLDLGIPAGSATLVSVGNTTTLAAGSNATVTSNLSGSNLTLAFGVPRGFTPAFSIGNVTTGAAGSSASVTATTANSGANVTLDLTIPRGDPGTSGSNGANGTSITLSDGTPANLGTAAAGSSCLSARADHVHNLPTSFAYANLTGTPANFPTNTTLVSGLNSSYSPIAHGHNYVTALNNLTGGLTLAAGTGVNITANGSTLTLSSTGGITANDSIDGGDYVGQLVYGITFGTQPQSVNTSVSQTLNISAATVSANAPTQSPVSISGGILALSSNFATISGVFTGTLNAVASTDNGATWTRLYGDTYQSNSFETISVDERPLTSASNGTRTLVAAYKVAYSDSPASGSWSKVPALSGVTDFDFSMATGTPRGAYTVAHNGQRFVVVGRSLLYPGASQRASLSAYRSVDGTNWSSSVLNYNYDVVTACLKPCVAVNGIFVIPGTSNSGAYPPVWFKYVWTSADGVTWQQTQYGTDATRPTNSDPSAFDLFRDIASSGTVAVGVNGSIAAAYTTNGTTWGISAMPVACTRISYAAGFFWAFTSSASTDVCYSRDGISWTLGTMPASAAWYGIAGDPEGFAVGVGGYATVRPSSSQASANLTVSASATGGSAVSYQWQRSLDAGTNWANVTNATTSTLSLTGLTTANSGTRYRAAASATGATTVFSQSATLTVTG